MGIPKTDKFPIQELAIRAIKVDHDLQSRVATSVEYQREFSEALLREERKDRIKLFPPVTVFFDGKTYWLADGFHRVGASKAAGMVSIRAEVREGSRRDAAVFSAGANQKFSIPRTNEDMRKAVSMLMGYADWRQKADQVIAKHCGVSNKTVKRVRVDYCNANDIPMPDTITRSDGRAMRYEKGKKPAILARRTYWKGGKQHERQTPVYTAAVAGKDVYLGMDAGEAEVKLRGILSERRARADLNTPEQILMLTRKFGLAAVSTHEHLSGGCRWGKGVVSVGGGVVCVSAESDAAKDWVGAVGRVLLLREQIDPDLRAVVLWHDLGMNSDIASLGKKLGVEFLTPDELVASLKAEVVTA